MHIFPYESFSIKTSLSYEQIYGKLIEVIEEDKQHNFRYEYKKPFHGIIAYSIFKVKPNNSFYNYYTPIITGIINHNGSNSIIEISMEPLQYIRYILFAYFIFTFSPPMYIFLTWLSDSAIFYVNPFVYILKPLGLQLILYVLIYIIFKWHWRYPKKLLKDILY